MQALLAAGVPVVLTADLDAADDAVTGLVRRLATTVRLPALAQHREHLPSLVRAVVAELPAPASRTRFSSAAWERLLAWHWPGNLAELHTTVVGIARRAAGGLVEEGDLPEELRGPRRGAGPHGVRRAESPSPRRCAPRTATAPWRRRALGIGRNTLYRKMREFGLE